ncbi:hypothetical protein, partial [Rickettsia endosymbiont of Culicoides newsteadi]|uniref:hypothetical protein n=1 Tax=Rickettsia endosymbiont of Culicoides newsteadi TaxID=1961830 RepID=UPI00195C9D07
LIVSMTIFDFSSALYCLTCFFISSSPFLLKNSISFLLFLCPKYGDHYSLVSCRHYLTAVAHFLVTYQQAYLAKFCNNGQ